MDRSEQGLEGGKWLGENGELTAKLGESDPVAYEPPEDDSRYPGNTWEQLGQWADAHYEGGGSDWLVRWERSRDDEGISVLGREGAAIRLMRFDGKRGRECSLKRMPEGFHPVGVDPTGALWGTAVVHEVDTSDYSMAGPVKVLTLVRFDCKVWDSDPPTFGVMPIPPRRVTIAGDGSVWVLAVPEDKFIEALHLPLVEQWSADVWPAQLYVITPEAVAAAE